MSAKPRSEKATEPGVSRVSIPAPNFRTAIFRIVGESPLVMHKFSAKARTEMRDKQAEGGLATKRRVRDPKDFDAVYQGAIHYLSDGTIGMPAAAFRAALISACRLVDFKMTIAKMSLFIESDGLDVDDGQPLVRIVGTPRPLEMMARVGMGLSDIRTRPIFETWACELRISYDADRFNGTDLANLLARAGRQVGVGEGRPDSKMSAGMGWGTFRIAEPEK